MSILIRMDGISLRQSESKCGVSLVLVLRTGVGARFCKFSQVFQILKVLDFAYISDGQDAILLTNGRLWPKDVGHIGGSRDCFIPTCNLKFVFLSL